MLQCKVSESLVPCLGFSVNVACSPYKFCNFFHIDLNCCEVREVEIVILIARSGVRTIRWPPYLLTLSSDTAEQ